MIEILSSENVVNAIFNVEEARMMPHESRRRPPVLFAVFALLWICLVACAVRGQIFLTPRFDFKHGIVLTGPARWTLVAAFSVGWVELCVRYSHPKLSTKTYIALKGALIALFTILVLVSFVVPNHMVLGYREQSEQLNSIPRPPDQSSF